MACKGKENIPPTKSCGCIETAKPPNQPNYYRYYDTPDGCDIFKKVLVTSRYGAMAGLLISTYDVLMYSHAIGFGPIMRRYAYHTIPLTLMGATFAGVTNTVLCMRNEDDLWNYFIGGFSCGPILRTYLGSNHAVLLGGLALGIIAMIKKDSVASGYQLLPQPPNHMWSLRKWRSDYTLVPDPKDRLYSSGSLVNFSIHANHYPLQYKVKKVEKNSKRPPSPPKMFYVAKLQASVALQRPAIHGLLEQLACDQHTRTARAVIVNSLKLPLITAANRPKQSQLLQRFYVYVYVEDCSSLSSRSLKQSILTDSSCPCMAGLRSNIFVYEKLISF